MRRRKLGTLEVSEFGFGSMNLDTVSLVIQPILGKGTTQGRKKL
jgi:hypothetical protein